MAPPRGVVSGQIPSRDSTLTRTVTFTTPSQEGHIPRMLTQQMPPGVFRPAVATYRPPVRMAASVQGPSGPEPRRGSTQTLHGALSRMQVPMFFRPATSMSSLPLQQRRTMGSGVVPPAFRPPGVTIVRSRQPVEVPVRPLLEAPSGSHGHLPGPQAPLEQVKLNRNRVWPVDDRGRVMVTPLSEAQTPSPAGGVSFNAPSWSTVPARGEEAQGSLQAAQPTWNREGSTQGTMGSAYSPHDQPFQQDSTNSRQPSRSFGQFQEGGSQQVNQQSTLRRPSEPALFPPPQQVWYADQRPEEKRQVRNMWIPRGEPELQGRISHDGQGYDQNLPTAGLGEYAPIRREPPRINRVFMPQVVVVPLHSGCSTTTTLEQ